MKTLNLFQSGKTLMLSALMAGQLLMSAHAGGSVVNSDGGVAIKGYDPVAYFKQGGPVKGSSDHSLQWQGSTWKFSSADNRNAFQANPEKFAPQYGGYCAFGAGMGLKIDIQPDQFRIVDNKLYINSSPQAQGLWLKDELGRIDLADEKWPQIKHKTAEELKAAL